MFQPIKITGQGVGVLEDFEYNFKNGCTVVQAENRDDLAQESNGGGKSTILDIPGICLLGSSLLGKSLKDIINWDPTTESMTVGYEMENKVTDQYVTITRKLFKKKSRSEELFITVNGECPKDLPTKRGVEGAVDVKLGNKFILDLLDITKENLLNRYLISTGNDYTSFFDISSDKKMQLIQQFSNTDKIDRAIEVMGEKRKEFDEILLSVDREIGVYQGRASAYNDQITHINGGEAASQFEVEKNRDIENVLTSIESKKDRQVRCVEVIQEKEKEIEIQQEDIKSQGDLAPIDPLIEEKTKALSVLREGKNTENTRVNPFNGKWDELAEEKQELIKQGEAVRKNTLETLTLKVELEGFKKHTTTCPKCEHKFVAHKTEFSAEEINLMLDDTIAAIHVDDEKIADIKKEIKELDFASIEKEKGAWNLDQNNKIAEISDDIREVENSISSLEGEKTKRSRAISTANQNIKYLQSAIEGEKESHKRLGQEMKEQEEQIITLSEKQFDKSEVDRLKKKIEDTFKLITDLEKSNEGNRILSEKHSQWILNYKDLKFYIIHKRVQSIAGHINYYLNQNGSDLSISIEGFKELKSGEIKQAFTPMIFRDGDNPQLYSQFSGGEKARLNLAADMAFQELINANSKSGGLNYYQSDELLNPVDSTGISHAAKAFDKLDKPILLASHSGKDLVYNKILLIIKENGIGTVNI